MMVNGGQEHRWFVTEGKGVSSEVCEEGEGKLSL